MLRIFLKQQRGWKELDNGPFPVTREVMESARAAFREEWLRTDPLEGCRQSPQTTARMLLEERDPQLLTFDKMMLGFAVTHDVIRMEEV